MIVRGWAVNRRNLGVVHSKVDRQLATVMGEVVEVIHNERVAWILPDYLATFEQSPRGLQISVCCCGYRVSGVCNGFVPLLSALRVSQDSEMFHCPLRF